MNLHKSVIHPHNITCQSHPTKGLDLDFFPLVIIIIIIIIIGINSLVAKQLSPESLRLISQPMTYRIVNNIVVIT